MYRYIYPEDPDLEWLRGRRCEVIGQCDSAYLLRVGNTERFRNLEIVLPKSQCFSQPKGQGHVLPRVYRQRPAPVEER